MKKEKRNWSQNWLLAEDNKLILYGIIALIYLFICLEYMNCSWFMRWPEFDYHVNYMDKSESWIVLEASEVPYS